MTTKTCTVCGKEKPASDYRLHSDKKTVMRYCNDCHLAKRRAQHAAKREERNAQFRERCAAIADGLDIESFGILPARAVQVILACQVAIRSLK